jgi:hypothetical protein
MYNIYYTSVDPKYWVLWIQWQAVECGAKACKSITYGLIFYALMVLWSYGRVVWPWCQEPLSTSATRSILSGHDARSLWALRWHAHFCVALIPGASEHFGDTLFCPASEHFGVMPGASDHFGGMLARGCPLWHSFLAVLKGQNAVHFLAIFCAVCFTQ